MRDLLLWSSFLLKTHLAGTALQRATNVWQTDEQLGNVSAAESITLHIWWYFGVYFFLCCRRMKSWPFWNFPYTHEDVCTKAEVPALPLSHSLSKTRSLSSKLLRIKTLCLLLEICMAKFSLALVLGPPWVFQRLHETLNHLTREQVFLLTSYTYEALQTL